MPLARNPKPARALQLQPHPAAPGASETPRHSISNVWPAQGLLCNQPPIHTARVIVPRPSLPANNWLRVEAVPAARGQVSSAWMNCGIPMLAVSWCTGGAEAFRVSGGLNRHCPAPLPRLGKCVLPPTSTTAYTLGSIIIAMGCSRYSSAPSSCLA